MKLRTLSLGLLAGVLLFPAAALAQDFPGEFELEGKYSNGRKTKVQLVVAGGSVTRRAEFTSGSWASRPAFTWKSSRARISGRKMLVTYYLNDAASINGMVDALALDADRDDVLDALEGKSNVVRALYTISADGNDIKEVAFNVTRNGDQGFWRWATSEGSRVQPTLASGPKISAAEFDAKTEKVLRDWYLGETKAVYDDEPNADPADKAYDMDYDNVVDFVEGSEVWEDTIDWNYDNNQPYRDAQGRVIARDDVVVMNMYFTPNWAGIGLSKVFVFSRVDGELLEEGDLQD